MDTLVCAEPLSVTGRRLGSVPTHFIEYSLLPPPRTTVENFCRLRCSSSGMISRRYGSLFCSYDEIGTPVAFIQYEAPVHSPAFRTIALALLPCVLYDTTGEAIATDPLIKQ